MDAKLEDVRMVVSHKLMNLELARKQLQEVRSELLTTQDKLAAYSEATQMLRDMYEQTQERFHGQIMNVVTHCLKSVFGPEAYEFKINFVQKRNQVEASFVFVRDGEEFDPLTMTGGGVLAVACFALRLAVIYLTRKSLRSVMVLDEPFSQLSVEYREPMVALLDQLSSDYDFQFIIITHAEEFEMGKVHMMRKV